MILKKTGSPYGTGHVGGLRHVRHDFALSYGPKNGIGKVIISDDKCNGPPRLATSCYRYPAGSAVVKGLGAIRRAPRRRALGPVLQLGDETPFHFGGFVDTNDKCFTERCFL
jgi:hypothetical protein